MSTNYRAVDQTGNGYCGPLTLAAILNCNTAEAAQHIRHVTGKQGAIRGTGWSALRDTLEYHGFRTEDLGNTLPFRYVTNRMPGMAGPNVWNDHTAYVRTLGDTCVPKVAGVKLACVPGNWSAPFTPVKRVGPTLAEWMRAKRDPAAFYIIQLAGHWVLVRGRKFVDTFTKGEWVFGRSAPHRRKRVKNVWKITERPS